MREASLAWVEAWAVWIIFGLPALCVALFTRKVGGGSAPRRIIIEL